MTVRSIKQSILSNLGEWHRKKTATMAMNITASLFSCPSLPLPL